MWICSRKRRGDETDAGDIAGIHTATCYPVYNKLQQKLQDYSRKLKADTFSGRDGARQPISGRDGAPQPTQATISDCQQSPRQLPSQGNRTEAAGLMAAHAGKAGMAVNATDSPTVQFLSHYHVLEHFFESVFNDDLIEQIKSSITQPGFSYKRKKDISQLIQTIKRSLQIRSETITFSEIDALKLSLAKFVNIGELVTRLVEYEPSLVDYYANTEVSFSKGAAVALEGADNEQVIRDLARRIYATTNSLVHSKDGDKARYTPFKDERALVMEVPLMRFISELVILAVSDIA